MAAKRQLPASLDRRARELLADRVLDIDEAALLLGYEDQNSFFRVFQLWEGKPAVQLTCHAPEPGDLAMRVLIVGASGMVGQGVLRVICYAASLVLGLSPV